MGMGTNIWEQGHQADPTQWGQTEVPQVPSGFCSCQKSLRIWRREPFFALWAQRDLGQLSSMAGMCQGGTEPFTTPRRAF